MARGIKTIKVDVSELERVLSDYVLDGIAQELEEYAGEGGLPDSSRLTGISIDLQFVANIAEQIEMEAEND